MATSRKPSTKRGIKVQMTNVQLHRGGLVIEMQGVPADQIAEVSAHMLDAVRSLVKRGYTELVVEGTPLHASPLGEVTDDPHADESKRLGFHAKL